MRKIFSTVTLVISMSLMAFSHDQYKGSVVNLVDYTVSYQWDSSQGIWIRPVKNQYVYGEANRVDMTVSLDLQTHDTISRTVFIFNDEGRRTEYYSQSYLDGEWIDVRKYMLIYDDSGRTLSQIVIDWKNTETTNWKE